VSVLPPVPGREIVKGKTLTPPWEAWINRLYTYLTSSTSGGGGLVSVNTQINTTAPLSGGGDLSTNRTLSINNNGVTNALLSQMPALTIKGNNTGGTANALDLTASQVQAMLQTWSIAINAAAFVPTSSTIPTNGLYLIGANNVGIAINSANAVDITAARAMFVMPVKHPTYTVATLPSAAGAGIGALAMVTDATLTAITGLGLAPTGGGANKVMVYSDGTNWLML